MDYILVLDILLLVETTFIPMSTMSTRTNIKPENNLVSILHYELHSCIRVDYKGQTQIPWTTFYMLLAKKYSLNLEKRLAKFKI